MQTTPPQGALGLAEGITLVLIQLAEFNGGSIIHATPLTLVLIGKLSVS